MGGRGLGAVSGKGSYSDSVVSEGWMGEEWVVGGGSASVSVISFHCRNKMQVKKENNSKTY